MPEAQANALTEAQCEVFSEVIDKALATKSDIESIEATIRKLDKRISVIEVEIRLLKWMLGIVIAGVGALVLKAFF